MFNKVIIITLAFLITYFFLGLVSFKDNILSSGKITNKINSNIVVLTGGSNRIKNGLKIIDNFDKSIKTKFKILISGTGKGFTKSSLTNMLNSNFDLELIECCIELESISKNTISNASETFKWAQKNKINQFILITSNYHMPRALLEFKHKMPNINIFIHPITPEKHDIENWLGSFETFSLVFIEYLKFLIANLRINFVAI